MIQAQSWNERASGLVFPRMMRSLLLTVTLCAAALAQSAPPARQFLLKYEPVRKDFTLQNMTESETPVINQHALYLNELLGKGVLTFAGQVFDPKGLWGLVVVNAPDVETATQIMNGDPAIKGKLFRGEALPFRAFQRAPKPPVPAPAK